jgi:TonB family protein
MIIAVITFGQERKRHMLPEVVVTPPRFTGTEDVLTKLQGEGIGYLKDYLISHIQYPENSLSWQEEGTEVVKFIVTPKGEVTDMSVINSVSPEIDKEVLRVLASTSGMWKPASNNGNPIAIEKEISIAFSADDPNPADRFVGLAKYNFIKGNKMLFLHKVDKKTSNFYNLVIQKDNKKALYYFNNAVRYVPNDKGLLVSRGVCKYQLGDKAGACKDWKRIKALGGIEGDSFLDNFCEFDGYSEMIDTLSGK